MSHFIYAVIGLAVTWSLYAAYMYTATRASEGRPAAPLFDLFPSLKGLHGRALVYCFSPQCGPCRPMSREVDQLLSTGAPIFKLDITRHREIVSEFGIRATPTLIVIDDGVVGRMLLGVKTAAFMHELIEKQPV